MYSQTNKRFRDSDIRPWLRTADVPLRRDWVPLVPMPPLQPSQNIMRAFHIPLSQGPLVPWDLCGLLLFFSLGDCFNFFSLRPCRLTGPMRNQTIFLTPATLESRACFSFFLAAGHFLPPKPIFPVFTPYSESSAVARLHAVYPYVVTLPLLPSLTN